MNTPDYRAGQERMRHIPEPAPEVEDLPAGPSNTAYPLNEQGNEDFNVGGVERTLPPKEQLEQLVSYMDATYPVPDFTPPWKGGSGDPGDADRYVANLPDRITHAAMLMLGSGLDHTMPGVAYGMNIGTTRELPALSDLPDLPGQVDIPARIFVPTAPTGRWAVSLHSGGWWRGSGQALELQWRPEVAAAAELSGTTILDLDHPLAPEADLDEILDSVRKAIGYVRSQEPASVTLWGYSSGGALAALAAAEDAAARAEVDALVLTFPDLDSVANLPEDLRGGHTVPSPTEWPRTLLQVALQDEIAARPDVSGASDTVQVAEYHSTHRIATPAENRRRVRDIADFLRSVD
nr:alpha/beta hydrolase [Corynebacterium tuscaniense]